MSRQASIVKQFALALLSRPQRCIYHCYYSFRESLPGLIGSSWSQNPRCHCSHRCWTDSFLPRQHQVFFYFFFNKAVWRTAIQRKVAMKTHRWVGPGSGSRISNNGKGEEHLGSNFHLALLSALWEKLFTRATGCLVQPGQLSGGIIPSGPHLHFNW